MWKSCHFSSLQFGHYQINFAINSLFKFSNFAELSKVGRDKRSFCSPPAAGPLLDSSITTANRRLLEGDAILFDAVSDTTKSFLPSYLSFNPKTSASVRLFVEELIISGELFH